MPHLFSVEGIEGSGKGTQLRLIEAYLQSIGVPMIVAREPGGTVYGELIRNVLKYPWLTIPAVQEALSSHGDSTGSRLLIDDQEIGGRTPECEMFLFLAARAEFFKEVVWPALKSGKHVFADRLHDSTRAYQGGGRFEGDPVMRKFINFANMVAMLGGLQPIATFFIDISVETSRRRIGLDSPDKIAVFEKEHDDFFERVRREYLLIAEEEPNRVIVINGERSPEEVFEDIKGHLQLMLPR